MSTPTHAIHGNRPWRTAVLAGMASYLDAAALVTSGVAVSVLYAPSLRLSAGDIGLILGCQQFSFAVGAFFGGRLGDRFGRRRIFTLSLFVFVVGLALLAFATGPVMLYTGAILSGLAVGADLPVSLAMINEEAPPDKKGKMVTFSQLLWGAGMGVALIMSSFLGHLGATGARVMYLVLLATAVIVLLLRFSMPESAEWVAARRRADEEKAGQSGAGSVRFADLGQLFRRPVVLVVIATALYYTCWNVGASIFGKYGALIWTKMTHGDVEVYSMIGLVGLAAGMLASTLFMRVVDTGARRVWTVVGSVLILLGWAPIALLGPSQPAVLAITFLFGVGSQFAGEPLYKVWSQELVPTLLRTSSQGLTLAFARVVTALVAVVVPTLLVAHSAYVFGAVLALAAVAVVIGQAWIPRLPKARDLQTPPVVADQPTAAVRDA